VLGRAREKEAWLEEQLTSSTAKWRIVGNQVIVSRLQVSNLDSSKSIVDTDLWQGYPAGRKRLLTFFRDNDIFNTAFLTGDIHSSWAIDVTFDDDSYEPTTQNGSICGEFVMNGPENPSPDAPGLAS
jgi:alkaline phosphatase D